MALNIVIAGSTGRMGRELIDALSREEGMRLHAALERPDCPALGEDAGGFAGLRSGVTIGADLDAALAGGHALIDFTRPAATMAHAEACARHGVKMIVGTTGFSDAQRARLEDLARDNAMVVAPNMSVGVTVLLLVFADPLISLVGPGLDASRHGFDDLFAFLAVILNVDDSRSASEQHTDIQVITEPLLNLPLIATGMRWPASPDNRSGIL
jgi:dihydrodipicolinate reductase